MVWPTVALFLLVVVLLTLARRSGSADRRLQLLRCLLPSWRFFETVEGAPLLGFRVVDAQEQLGPWQRAIPPRQRGAWRTFWNPQGNLRLAEAAIVEQLLDELAAKGPIEVEEAEALPSYRLTQRVALVSAAAQLPAGTRYQLRLATYTPGADPAEEELWVSGIYVA